jgi:hypothetical protein
MQLVLPRTSCYSLNGVRMRAIILKAQFKSLVNTLYATGGPFHLAAQSIYALKDLNLIMMSLIIEKN